MNVTEEQLEKRFPHIEWRKPIRITVPGVAQSWGCRFCIAAYGQRAQDAAEGIQSLSGFAKHMLDIYGRRYEPPGC